MAQEQAKAVRVQSCPPTANRFARATAPRRDTRSAAGAPLSAKDADAVAI
jgi:hypothetical protein